MLTQLHCAAVLNKQKTKMDIQITGVLVSKTGDFIHDYQEFDIQGGQEGLNSILTEELEPDTLYWIKAIFVMNGVEYESKPAQFSTVALVNPFTITNTDSSAITVEMKKFGVSYDHISLSYLTGDGWQWWDSDDGDLTVTLQPNESIIMKGTVGNQFGRNAFGGSPPSPRSSTMHGWGFAISGQSTVSGNLMYLVDPTGESTSIGSYVFGSLFCDCAYTDFDVQLPATDLYEACYEAIFEGCSSITKAPDLPATILADDCYKSMFKYCTSLVNAPVIYATGVKNNSTDHMVQMFFGCTSLVNAPQIRVICDYGGMFMGCTSLTNAPAIPVSERAPSCDFMFKNCTSLVNAPALPATTLSRGCYESMFEGCTSLVNAPALPATSTYAGREAYKNMFKGCTSLVNAPSIGIQTVLNNQDIFYGMFYGCSSLNKITLNATSWDTSLATDWVNGVAATGDFYNLGGATIQSGVSGIPSGWTEHTSI